MIRNWKAWLLGVRELDPRPVPNGVPTEVRWGGEVVWRGDMDNDLAPNQMVPDVLERAAFQNFPDGRQCWKTVHGRYHPNDFTGYPAVPGDPKSWIVVVDVMKCNGVYCML